MDGIVDVYDQVTPAPANGCDWLHVSSVRIALVGRNGQPDKNIVTTAAPTWAASVANNPAGSTMLPIDLTGTNAALAASGFTWQNYRYKVFETTVPIRNISIIGAPTAGANAGC
jgi:type IV pilus assembly protein PilW